MLILGGAVRAAKEKEASAVPVSQDTCPLPIPSLFQSYKTRDEKGMKEKEEKERMKKRLHSLQSKNS